jgi:hypothetical protein
VQERVLVVDCERAQTASAAAVPGRSASP